MVVCKTFVATSFKRRRTSFAELRTVNDESAYAQFSHYILCTLRPCFRFPFALSIAYLLGEHAECLLHCSRYLLFANILAIYFCFSFIRLWSSYEYAPCQWTQRKCVEDMNDTKHLCQFTCSNTDTCTMWNRYYNEITSKFAGNRLLCIFYIIPATL